MITLGAAFVLVVAVSVGLTVLASRRVRMPGGGPTGWGQAAARRWRATLVVPVAVIGGWLGTVAIMIPIGLAARSAESYFDRPVARFVFDRVGPSPLTKAMERLTIMGNRPIVELAAIVAVIVLGRAYGRSWWLPSVAVGSAFLLQREAQNALAGAVARDLPPGHNAGGFPSGGVSRVIAVYGMIIALTILLLPRTQHAWRAWLWSGLAVAATIEAFTRVYLSQHWTTDALAGLVLGVLLLVVEITALHAAVVAIPGAPQPAGRRREHPGRRQPTR